MKPRSIPTADDTVIRHVQIADGICRFSLFDWARANGVKPANAVFSLRGLLKRIPTLGNTWRPFAARTSMEALSTWITAWTP